MTDIRLAVNDRVLVDIPAAPKWDAREAVVVEQSSVESVRPRWYAVRFDTGEVLAFPMTMLKFVGSS